MGRTRKAVLALVTSIVLLPFVYAVVAHAVRPKSLSRPTYQNGFSLLGIVNSDRRGCELKRFGRTYYLGGWRPAATGVWISIPAFVQNGDSVTLVLRNGKGDGFWLGKGVRDYHYNDVLSWRVPHGYPASFGNVSFELYLNSKKMADWPYDDLPAARNWLYNPFVSDTATIGSNTLTYSPSAVSRKGKVSRDCVLSAIITLRDKTWPNATYEVFVESVDSELGPAAGPLGTYLSAGQSTAYLDTACPFGEFLGHTTVKGELKAWQSYEETVQFKDLEILKTGATTTIVNRSKQERTTPSGVRVVLPKFEMACPAGHRDLIVNGKPVTAEMVEIALEFPDGRNALRLPASPLAKELGLPITVSVRGSTLGPGYIPPEEPSAKYVQCLFEDRTGITSVSRTIPVFELRLEQRIDLLKGKFQMGASVKFVP